MMLELDTAGNIRLEDGRPSDLWYASCTGAGAGRRGRAGGLGWGGMGSGQGVPGRGFQAEGSRQGVPGMVRQRRDEDGVVSTISSKKLETWK